MLEPTALALFDLSRPFKRLPWRVVKIKVIIKSVPERGWPGGSAFGRRHDPDVVVEHLEVLDGVDVDGRRNDEVARNDASQFDAREEMSESEIGAQFKKVSRGSLL